MAVCGCSGTFINGKNGKEGLEERFGESKTLLAYTIIYGEIFFIFGDVLKRF